MVLYKRDYKKFIAVAIIFMLFGLTIGFCFGSAATAKTLIIVGMHFLKLNNLSVDINAAEIERGFNMYEDNIIREWGK